MTGFFIRRPIVAMVLSILLVLLGAVSILRLPVAQFPNIAPPEIMLQGTYVGADALTVEQSLATPLEQQMSGVDRMLYMYSINGSNGQTTLRVDFDVGTDPNVDQLLAHMRYAQAEPQLPKEVRGYGVTIRKSMGMPLVLFSLTSPNGSFDATFLANYAYINLADPLARIPGVGQIMIFGAGQYAMRLWVKPDQLAKLGVTVTDILNALKQQNVVTPVGQVGAEPVPGGQEFTYTVRTQGRLVTQEEFSDIIVRANSDGSFVRLRDVGRAELGAQLYNFVSRLNGTPTAAIAVYQLPGSNAIETVTRLKQQMETMKQRFPDDLDYVVSLDTTLAVTEGLHEILTTLWEAIFLVSLVVFLFLQSWRATLIPLLAVPVSLIGTFALFPLLGFSINTLSLFGLVLAIGLVVDDAIVVVEAVEHHIEQGLAPREATLKAMDEVAGPVVASALILVAVFVPTAFIPGITGRLYQQFAVTIAVSVVLSAINALTLSPALAALLLKPKQPAQGGLGRFFGWFNRAFGRLTERYVGLCGSLIQKAGRTLVALVFITAAAGLLGARLPSGFIPLEDTGYFLLNVQLPPAASLQRTDAVMKKVDALLAETPGVEYYTTVSGYGVLSQTFTTYNAVVFVALKPWAERTSREQQYKSIILSLNEWLSHMPEAVAFAFPPPAIPGVGTTGAVTFILEDRTGQPFQFLAEQTQRFVDAASKRPETARVITTLIPSAPQWFAEVDRDKALKQGVALKDLYQTLQTFMGGSFVNYFNRFGRLWQVYVEAEPEYRTKAEQVGQFYVQNNAGQMVPLSTLVTMRSVGGPEFTMRYNEYRAAQINAMPAAGYSSRQVMRALEEVFAETMPKEMGFDYMGMSYQEQVAAKGLPPVAIFGLSLLFVFLILAAQYESWALPVSVLLATPISVFGAFAALSAVGLEQDVYSQIGLVMLIGLSAKNAILIVEFARLEVEKGRPLVEAALAGARLRLRPIVMTAFAFILGVLPLVAASGSGAHARVILGFTVLGGMVAASILAIVVIPVFYYRVERWTIGRKVSLSTTVPIAISVPRKEGPDMFRWILIAFIAMGFTACKMGPDYARPDTPAKDSWRVPQATAESIANLAWWDLLKDQELQKLVRIALVENQDLRTAMASVEQYRNQLIIAKFDLAPSLSYNSHAFLVNTQKNANTIPTGGGAPIVLPNQVGSSSGTTFSNEAVFGSLKWEIDLWGRLRRSVEASQAQLLSQKENQRAVILGLMSGVAESYFELRSLDLQVEITKRTLKSWEESVRLSQLRFKQGYIPKLDLDRFEAERAGAAARLAELEKQVAQKENQLSALLGRKPAKIPRGLALIEQPMPPQVPAGLPSDLLQRRPDLLQAEQELAAATAGIGVAQAQRFPQLALTGSLGGASSQLSSQSLGPLFIQNVGAQLAGPLLNATALGYQVQVNEMKAQQAALQYEKTVVTALKEVEDALIAVEKTGEQRAAQEQQVTALQSALHFAGQRYQGGRASYLDVLTSQRSLFDAEMGLARTRQAQLVSVVQLYKALGGGWSVADHPESNLPDPRSGNSDEGYVAK